MGPHELAIVITIWIVKISKKITCRLVGGCEASKMYGKIKILGCDLKFIQVIQDVTASGTWYDVEIDGKYIYTYIKR